MLIHIELPIDLSFDTEPDAWTRMIVHLVGNALKYTLRGRINVILGLIYHVIAKGIPDGKAVCLEVTDTGRGISKGFLQHRRFEPLAQEDSLSVGTGLGLSIAQRLVEGLRGSVDVQSEVGTAPPFA